MLPSFGLARPEFDFPWYKFTVIKTQEAPVLATGSTPIKWLQRNRAYKAQELLEDTTKSMEHIAEQVGYQSSETFRVAFKKVIGVSPGTYRANFKTK